MKRASFCALFALASCRRAVEEPKRPSGPVREQATAVGPATLAETVATEDPPRPVREAAKAGTWYPGGRRELARFVDGALGEAKRVEVAGELLGVLAPHAGYAYSGKVAGWAFKQLEGREYDAVVVFGACHSRGVRAGAIWPKGAFRTPLGLVRVEESIAEELLRSSAITEQPFAHAGEHSIETELPFLQRTLPRTPIVPIVVGPCSPEEIEEIARAVAGACGGKKVLLVVSTDLTHFPDYETAVEVDASTVEAICSLSPEVLRRVASSLEDEYAARGVSCALCGPWATQVFLATGKAMGCRRAKVLKTLNSGDVSGDKSRVVGYAAIAFYGREMMISPAGRKKLLVLARKTLESTVRGEARPKIEYDDSDLQGKQGCFVTYKNPKRRQELRGCIGRFRSDKPLWKTVAEVAVESATMDSRFAHDPIGPKELPDIVIDISVLSPLEPTRKPLDIPLGVHGIHIDGGGYKRGVFLPQVATETGWSKEEFWTHVCPHKAGLPADAWTHPDKYKLSTFAAEVFSEKDE